MIGAALQKALRQQGYAADWVDNAADAEECLRGEAYGLAVLDLGLPDRSGLEILRDLRARGADIPVLILTARDGVADRVAGLDAGADDYMLKPFALEELEARIRALSRRRQGQSAPLLSCGALTLNPATHEASFGAKGSVLPAREFALLAALMEMPGRILSRAQLEERLYGWNEEVASNAVEVHVHQIRKKLGAAVIKNVRNAGYMVTGEL